MIKVVVPKGGSVLVEFEDAVGGFFFSSGKAAMKVRTECVDDKGRKGTIFERRLNAAPAISDAPPAENIQVPGAVASITPTAPTVASSTPLPQAAKPAISYGNPTA